MQAQAACAASRFVERRLAADACDEQLGDLGRAIWPGQCELV